MCMVWFDLLTGISFCTSIMDSLVQIWWTDPESFAQCHTGRHLWIGREREARSKM